MSEDDDDDDEHDGEHRRSKSSGMGQTLSTIPMAVGDTNYLKTRPGRVQEAEQQGEAPAAQQDLGAQLPHAQKGVHQPARGPDRRPRRAHRRPAPADLAAERGEQVAQGRGAHHQGSHHLVAGRGQDSGGAADHDIHRQQPQRRLLPGNGGALNVSGDVASGRSSPTNEFGGAPSGVLTPGAFLNFGSDASRPGTPTFAVPGSPRAQSPRPSLLRRSSPSLMPQANTKKDVAPSSSFWGGVGKRECHQHVYARLLRGSVVLSSLCRKERGNRHCVKQEACARKDGPRSKKLGEEEGVGVDIGGSGMRMTMGIGARLASHHAGVVEPAWGLQGRVGLLGCVWGGNCIAYIRWG
ncbi:hypothetical protein L1887_49669 [Cichorium endivia]|nr:hypothetical protein L1887_49669 [Cichorium endivia]